MVAGACGGRDRFPPRHCQPWPAHLAQIGSQFGGATVRVVRPPPTEPQFSSLAAWADHRVWADQRTQEESPGRSDLQKGPLCATERVTVRSSRLHSEAGVASPRALVRPRFACQRSSPHALHTQACSVGSSRRTCGCAPTRTRHAGLPPLTTMPTTTAARALPPQAAITVPPRVELMCTSDWLFVDRPVATTG